MPYTEKLSEQLTVADSGAQVTTTSGSTTITGTAIDGANYNRLIAYVIGEVAKSMTAASYSIKWQAASVVGMTGATTITTCTGDFITTTAAAAVTTVGSCEVSGEQVQSARAAEDRYVRAVVVGTAGSAHVLGIEYMALADAKRYHPN